MEDLAELSVDDFFIAIASISKEEAAQLIMK